MRFEATALSPVCVVVGDEHEDPRGSFTRVHCEREFADAKLPARMVQTNLSRNRRRGTLRGLHYQTAPSREGKLVRCIAGAIYDVAVDLRAASPTYCGHFGIELTPAGGRALFIPPGFAHGFQTLADDTVVLYHMSDYYQAALGAGVRWDDPAFGIEWPIASPILNERDAGYPGFDRGRPPSLGVA